MSVLYIPPSKLTFSPQNSGNSLCYESVTAGLRARAFTSRSVAHITVYAYWRNWNGNTTLKNPLKGSLRLLLTKILQQKLVQNKNYCLFSCDMRFTESVRWVKELPYKLMTTIIEYSGIVHIHIKKKNWKRFCQPVHMGPHKKFWSRSLK